MAVYQQKAKERIKKSLRKFKPIAAKATKNAVNEADTRVLVSAVLSEALGWDPFAELTGEHLIKASTATSRSSRTRDVRHRRGQGGHHPALAQAPLPGRRLCRERRRRLGRC